MSRLSTARHLPPPRARQSITTPQFGFRAVGVCTPNRTYGVCPFFRGRRKFRIRLHLVGRTFSLAFGGADSELFRAITSIRCVGSPSSSSRRAGVSASKPGVKRSASQDLTRQFVVFSHALPTSRPLIPSEFPGIKLHTLATVLEVICSVGTLCDGGGVCFASCLKDLRRSVSRRSWPRRSRASKTGASFRRHI